MKHVFAAAIALSLLAGCGLAPEGALSRDAVRLAAARAADEVLADIEWALCHAMTIGAVKRRYGHVPAKVAAFQLLCNEAPTGPYMTTGNME